MNMKLLEKDGKIMFLLKYLVLQKNLYINPY